MDHIFALLTDPAAWLALVTLVVMEVVLGIDNLVFVAILSNKLPEEQRKNARRIGIGLALVMRLILLSTIAWIVSMTKPLFSAFGHDFSVRDLILLAGGLFLLWKATTEIRHNVEPHGDEPKDIKTKAINSFASAIVQIIVLDLVFSIDSILTAVGMTNDLPIMFAAVIITVGLMLVAADPLANFINNNPSVVMLALGFLLMIGMMLIADAFGFHVPKGYIYAAMAFSGGVEALNMWSRKSQDRKAAKH
jgi:predicted tellurium resistance membrane protein TerC